MVQSFCKNLFLGSESRKNNISVKKSSFFAENPPELQVSMS